MNQSGYHLKTMESMKKKMRSSKGINCFKDRLSDMPDHLILHILSFLPTLDAVKTMLLRRFGNLWTLVPALKFDLAEYDRVVCPEMDKLTIFEVFLSFSRFVRNVLMLRRSPIIDRFDLIIAPFEVRFENCKKIQDIQMWLRFAIDKQVKYLDFVFDGFDDLTLPHCVATSQSLTKLELSGCVLEDQPRVNVHMKSLRKLLLSDVKGSNEAFNQLIAGCPSLQELIIDTIDELNVLNVTSPTVSRLSLTIQHPEYDSLTLSCPNVKTLDIYVSSSYQSFMVNAIDISSLQVVNVIGLLYSHWSPVEAFLRQFQNVKVFTLSSNAYQSLCQGNETDFPVTRWKRIVLCPYWKAKNSLQLILTMVKKSAELEELIIHNEFDSLCSLCQGNETDFPVTRWKRIVLCPYWKAKNSLQLILTMVKKSAELEELIIHNEFDSLCGLYASSNPELCATSVMQLLKNVTIHVRGRCFKVQLQLVELLLGNAIVLEKLVISFDQRRPTTVEKVDFVEQVSRFRRASTKANVIFA